MRSRVELFEQIRRDRRLEQLSIRELADKHGVHRRTVRQALESAVPPPRKEYPRRPRPAMDAWVAVIDGWLRGDREAPRKQRHTARRVWQRLVAEHGACWRRSRCLGMSRGGGSSWGWTTSRWRSRRPTCRGRRPRSTSASSTLIGGTWIKLWMFVMRLSHSGRAFHMAFGNQAQESFLEGHVPAFEHFGGSRPDPLRQPQTGGGAGAAGAGPGRVGAVHRAAQPLLVRSFFCLPGKEGAHEKGGVEGEIGRFRRRHLVPVPAVRRWPNSTS